MTVADSCAPMRVSVVMPILDEAPRLRAAIESIGAVHECVVVDGGSRDGGAELAANLGARVVSAARGRSAQMNAGAAVATGEVLLFLHADTRLPTDWVPRLQAAMARRPAGWGRFDVRLDDPAPSLRLIGSMMNIRSRLTGICTGDQAMFVSREAWLRSGGFPPIALMEDIELSASLRRLAGRPLCIGSPVIASARRWRRHGIVRTVVSMWRLRFMYWWGVSPDRLHAIYYGRRDEPGVR